MNSYSDVDAALVQWGDRLFYPGNRMVRANGTPRLHESLESRARNIRRSIEATVIRRAPQVVMKISGGGRGMAAIARHFGYISRGGRLALEDDRGFAHCSKEEINELLQQWRYGGALIPDVSDRREALNFVLATPAGTDPQLLKAAARDFAHAKLREHRYVMVLHEDRANPHVHLTVRARSMSGRYLQTWTEWSSWRSELAQRLRALGVDVEATRQAVRGENRTSYPIWQRKAEELGLLRTKGAPKKLGETYFRHRAEAMVCWSRIVTALEQSPSDEDRSLAEKVRGFLRETPFFRELVAYRDRLVAEHARIHGEPSRHSAVTLIRQGPELTR